MKERRFRACAGADVRNIYDEVQKHGGVPSILGLQLEQGILTDDVKLITITIGGNDVGFAKVLKFCALLFPPTDGCLNNEFDPYDEFEPDPTLENVDQHATYPARRRPCDAVWPLTNRRPQ